MTKVRINLQYYGATTVDCDEIRELEILYRLRQSTRGEGGGVGPTRDDTATCLD